MMAIITQDQFLYHGLRTLFSDGRVTRFRSISEFSAINSKASTVIIDLMCGDGLSLKQAKKIGKIDAEKIFLLSAFRASRMTTISPVYFICRSIPPASLRQLITSPQNGLTIREPVFSVTQLEVARQWHIFQDDKKIAAHLGMSPATFRIHKYQLMLKLRLKKMCHIVKTDFHHYVTDTDSAAQK